MERSHDAVKKLQLRAVQRLRAELTTRGRNTGGAPWSVTSVAAPMPSTATGTLSAHGETTPATADLDADLVTLVARLHAAGSATPTLFPDPDQAWRELRQMSTPAAVSGSEGETNAPAWPYPNGHVLADLFPRQLETPLPRGVGAAGPHPAGGQPPCCC